jgi:hypothetical protein
MCTWAERTKDAAVCQSPCLKYVDFFLFTSSVLKFNGSSSLRFFALSFFNFKLLISPLAAPHPGTIRLDTFAGRTLTRQALRLIRDV